jgi:hypothetical protein
MNISEDKYFEWKAKLDGQNDLARYVRLALVIFTKVLDKELNASVSDNFLRKCYIDNLLITKTVLSCISRGMYTWDEKGGKDIEENIVTTLSILHRARVHLAKRLLERENDPSYSRKMQPDYRYFDRVAFADSHRCSLHIKSKEFNSSRYQFEKFEDGVTRFAVLFSQVHAKGRDEFISNIDVCLGDPCIKRDIGGYRRDQSIRN